MNQHDLPEPPVPELASLAQELAPPADLESRVASVLRDQSLLKTRRFPWALAAAAILLIATGVLIGRLSVASPANSSSVTTTNRFLFMLTDSPATGDDVARAEQYRRWAVDLRSEGRQITGERLAPSGIAVTRAGSGPIINPEVQGFFIVTAADITDAAAVARKSPHVQSGGLILVRPIDTP